jgi:type VI secretion system protein ImpF
MIDIEKRAEFCRMIEKTINFFEPRFKSVHVNYITNKDQTDRTLRFRIEAVLYAEPMPEKIIFDSILEPVSRSVSVEEA